MNHFNNFIFSLGFGSLSSDWTTLDPAIVSFRQFPSFLPQQQQQQQQQPPQHSAADMFMPQLNQQQQPGQGELQRFFFL